MTTLAKTVSVVALLSVGILLHFDEAGAPEQNWTHFVRIGAYGLKSDNADAIVGNATKTHVFGIEVDNDIPGRYESFVDPTVKLKAIKSVADAAHQAHNRAFVYIAGTECITASADKSPHSVLKDHPDWIQRKLTGEPAVFTSGAAFWISPGDEDVWISPYAKEWRKVYMERVRQIAATGMDGIYVDIPYWMTHFDGWENSWASFDDATVAAFREKTGLDARKDLKLGDFHDGNFRKWIDFRISTLTDFLAEIGDNARSVNPHIMLIPEIYPGIEEESTRVGADVYEMYGVSDAIAHEYEFGSGEHMASSRTQLDWFLYQAGMLSFRAFAQGKATWILNYSWDGDKNVDAREAMKNLAMSQVIAGANFWDAPGHSMAGSNDEATRTEIFKWIEENQKTLYTPREPMQPIGVYFSPKSRDYDAENFLPSYRGLLMMLLQAHREFQIVTPKTLAEFHGNVLVLAGVSALSATEKQTLKGFNKRGGQLVITGQDATELGSSQQIVRMPDCPGKSYLAGLQRDFLQGSREVPETFLRALKPQQDISVDAPTTIATNFARVEGIPHIFMANFAGLVPGKIATPTLASGIKISAPAADGAVLVYLPFLGERQTLHGAKKGDRMEFVLPPVERGAIAWIPGQSMRPR
ncbi:MAG: hypothetical protein WCE52_07855 [Candidatus Acidiferrum sp.]